MDDIFLIFTMITFVIVLSYKYYKYNYNLLLRLSFWFIIFYFFYFLYAALCLDSFSVNDRFYFSKDTITKAKHLVSSLGIILIAIFSQLTFPSVDDLIFYRPVKIVSYLAFFIILSSFVIFSVSLKNLITLYKSFGKTFNYMEYRVALEQIRAKSHIKILVYMLLAVDYFYCIPEKKFKYLIKIDFFLAMAFDFISGTRTVMFLIVLYQYIITIRRRKNSYIVFMLIISCVVLFSSEIIRSIGLNPEKSNSSIPEKILLGIGEFNNSLVTLPYIIEGRIEPSFDLIDLISWANFIPPLIRFFNKSNLGDIYQFSINRGIGYASNIVSNWYYISDICCVFFITIFFLLFIYFDKKTYKGEFFLLKILMICFVRNFMREGIASFMTFIYIFVVYFGVFILLNKQNRRFLCINCKH